MELWGLIWKHIYLLRYPSEEKKELLIQKLQEKNARQKSAVAQNEMA